MQQNESKFDNYAREAMLVAEKKGAVCSFCGARLPTDYYLLLSAWRSQEKELVSPSMRFCQQCWERIEMVVYSQVRQLQMAV